jgi:hypothetical protein
VIISDVMDQLAARANTIDGLRCFAYPPATLTPPAAVVSYPTDYTYDATYARGMDRLSLPLVVVVGRPTDRSTRDNLARYVDGSGVASIKAVLESGTYTAFDVLRVESAEFDVVTIGGVDYMAALFTLDIAGQGSA